MLCVCVCMCVCVRRGTFQSVPFFVPSPTFCDEMGSGAKPFSGVRFFISADLIPLPFFFLQDGRGTRVCALAAKRRAEILPRLVLSCRVLWGEAARKVPHGFSNHFSSRRVPWGKEATRKVPHGSSNQFFGVFLDVTAYTHPKVVCQAVVNF